MCALVALIAGALGGFAGGEAHRRFVKRQGQRAMARLLQGAPRR